MTVSTHKTDLPYLKLNHTNAAGEASGEVIIKFDPLDRKHTWMDQAVLVPWTAPHRLFGWVHPDAKPETEPFVLHGAFIYVGTVGMQQVDSTKVRAVEGPKLLLPYDMISQVDMDIYRCPSLVWMRKQGAEMRELFVSLVSMHVLPKSMIDIVKPNELPPDIDLRSDKRA